MVNIKTLTKVSLLIFLLQGTLTPLSAQESNPLNSLNRAAQYFLGKGDEVLIKINILGFVQRPGQYLIPRHTDLLSLISFAGGFQQGAKLTKIQIIRKGALDVSGNGHSGQQSKR